MSRTRVAIAVLFVIPAALVLVVCARGQAPTPTATETPPPVETAAYAWLADWNGTLPPIVPLEHHLPAPAGLQRTEVAAGSFAAWLRALPVRLDRRRVETYRGFPLPVSAAAIIALDLGKGDLQQCADTLLRLHAEYLWTSHRGEQAGYHFTSGDLSTWRAWVAGERFKVSGSRVQRLTGTRRSDDHGSYRSWLQHLFLYAGTMSLALDSDPVAAQEPLVAGDFFVEPGSPGHTVMIVDVAVDEDGKRYGLIGQGYTPAQDLHVLAAGYPEVRDRAWFPLPEHAGEQLQVPSWSPFPRSTARRFHITAPAMPAVGTGE